MIFMRKYWYMDSVADIARAMGMTESAVKVTLHRTREKFRKHLDKEGITV
jgi:RNA polymerase sigma-70 factor (ECF subfamily)